MPIACNLDDIRDRGCREFSFHEGDEKRFGFLVRVGQTVWAYRNACPHLLISMNWLRDHFLDHREEHIQCALHGALFEIDTGLCVTGPCFGRYLQSIPVVVIDRRIELPMPVSLESSIAWGEKPSICD